MQLAYSKTSTENVQPLPESWIERLLDKMLLSYGKKFLDQWGGVDTDKLVRHWSEELASFTREELGRGYAALETREWPPTLPEFKKLCRPGIDAANAYQEAVAGVNARERGEIGTWSHPAIYWAASCMAYDLKHQAYQSIAKRWETALQAEMSKGEWSAIPQPMIALPAPGKSLSSRQQATDMLQKIGASDVLKPRNDHRAWIAKIAERAKAGDDTLPGISLRFAKEAMEAREAK
jgi:hypothetical protein